MDLKKPEIALKEIFGEKNVKSFAKGFRIIINYEDLPYCAVLMFDHDKLVLERDAVDQDEINYEEAYRKVYKELLRNKDAFECEIMIKI